MIVLLGVLGCSPKPSPGNTSAATSTTEVDDGMSYGAAFAVDGPMDVASVLAALAEQDSIVTQLHGEVQEVCKVKGCWMTVVAPGEDEGFMVKFQDYGFFVPTDFENTEVILAGKAYKEVTPVDELRHYAEDAGKSAEEIAAITEPVEEYKFMATGVRVVR